MKKLLLTITAVGFAFAISAQNRPAPLNTIKERLQRSGNLTTVPYQQAITGSELPVGKVNQTVKNYVTNLNKSSQAQVVIGSTTYDLQTNGSVQNRIYKRNGTVGATWTMSGDLGGTYPDRGAGYNYFDGSSWGPIPAPSARIETDRRGWPSLVRLDNGGEVVVSHQALANPTATNIRPSAGSGTWTQTPIPAFPGGENTLWVRTAAGGPDGNTVHMIDITYPTGNGGALVNGLNGCFNYSRSLDGGANWDIQRVLPPGVNDQEYIGFRADAYAIDAVGNTVAFVSGNLTDDWALWKSTDNGSTWTRTVIMDFPFTKYDDTSQITDINGDGIADTLLTTDGSYAMVIDNNGVVHAFAGAMLILDNDPAGLLGLFLSTDGLLYWNETMGSNPPVVVTSAPDMDGDGIASNFETNLGGRYGNDGICSMPSVGVDANNYIYLSYCPLIEGTSNGNPAPNAFSFRNVYLMASGDGGNTWGDPINVSNSMFDEAVFCAVAKHVDNCVSMIWQQDGDPGYSVPPNGQHAVSFNDIVYDCIDVNLVLGINNPGQINGVSLNIYPNPASSQMSLNYTIEKPVNIQVEIRNLLGQVIDRSSHFAASKGTFTVNKDISSYSNGMYTVNTIVGTEVISTKFVKN
jgi:hypothetical protein